MRKNSFLKNLKMPHVYVVILIALFFASILTYIIPAGVYERTTTEAGTTMVIVESFKNIEANPRGPWLLPYYCVTALIKQANIIMPMIVIGGSLEIVLATGMFHSYCSQLALKCKGKEKLFIPVIMAVFTVIGFTQEPVRFIGFAPLGVMLAASLGYDAIVGVSIIMIGIAIGFVAGPLSAQTVAAQELAELPAFSGIGLRLAACVVFYVLCVGYVVRYAEQSRKNPEASLVYNNPNVLEFKLNPDENKIEKRHKWVLLVVVAAFSVLMYGALKYGWGIIETSICFLWMGVAAGLIYGFNADKLCAEFTKGCKGMVSAAILIGLGAAVSLILSDANILDTVVHAMGNALNYVPAFLQAPVMFLMNLVINVFVPSGLGQAALVMPVMTPVADIVGMSRQTLVMAYKFGDGISNYILPNVSSLMGFLAAASISYSTWMKFMWKLFVYWVIIAAVFVSVAGFIGY